MCKELNKYVVNCDSTSMKKDGHVYNQLLVTTLIGLTLLNYGLQSGWASPMKKVLQSDSSPSGTPVTDEEMSWIASVIPLAGVFGSVLFAYLADALGRKTGVILMFILQAICWIIKLITTNTIALIFARALAGLSAGGCFNLVPMYINEISQENIRGAMVALAMAFTNIGYLVMYAMGGFLDYFLIIWIATAVAIVAGTLFIVIVPESPGYLVKLGKLEDAAQTVAYLRGLQPNDIIVQNALDYMKKQEEKFKSVKNVTFSSIFQNKACVRGFLLCMFNFTCLNLHGTLSINTFAWSIMMTSGVTVNPELQTLCIPIILIFGSLVSLVCVEKFGRKRLLIATYLLSALSLSCLGTVLLLQHHYDVTVPSWLPVVAIVVAVWACAAGVLPMVYVIISEMFTFQVRAKLIGVIISYACFIAFAQVFCYLPISNAFGVYTTFYMYAGVNLVGGLVCLLFLPETMGKTVEEIEKLLLGSKAH